MNISKEEQYMIFKKMLYFIEDKTFINEIIYHDENKEGKHISDEKNVEKILSIIIDNLKYYGLKDVKTNVQSPIKSAKKFFTKDSFIYDIGDRKQKRSLILSENKKKLEQEVDKQTNVGDKIKTFLTQSIDMSIENLKAIDFKPSFTKTLYLLPTLNILETLPPEIDQLVTSVSIMPIRITKVYNVMFYIYASLSILLRNHKIGRSRLFKKAMIKKMLPDEEFIKKSYETDEDYAIREKQLQKTLKTLGKELIGESRLMFEGVVPILDILIYIIMQPLLPEVFEKEIVDEIKLNKEEYDKINNACQNEIIIDLEKICNYKEFKSDDGDVNKYNKLTKPEGSGTLDVLVKELREMKYNIH